MFGYFSRVGISRSVSETDDRFYLSLCVISRYKLSDKQARLASSVLDFVSSQRNQLLKFTDTICAEVHVLWYYKRTLFTCLAMFVSAES